MTTVNFSLPSINTSLHHRGVEFTPQTLNLDWSYDCLDQENEEEFIFWYIRDQEFLPLRTKPYGRTKMRTKVLWSTVPAELPDKSTPTPHIWVSQLGSSNLVKPPDNCSPSWYIAKEKNCPARPSQPTETWDNDYCFKSLNFVGFLCSNRSLKHMGILFIYLSQSKSQSHV